MAKKKTRRRRRRRRPAPSPADAPAARVAGGADGASPRLDAARRQGSSGSRGEARRAAARSGPPRVREGFEALLHPRAPGERPWKLLPLVLVLAFAVRAAVALSGDFVLHPDEIMQYLEPAHRVVFGSGVTYWEYFYGARSWLVPGLVAGVLQLFDAVGLGEPFWYVGGVKLVFCAISLTIPAGMYFFARGHFSEAAARVALITGAFWYELAGLAHKPMTEFVATAALVALLALCARPAAAREPAVWPAALLAVLAAAIRLQYAPLALLLLGIVFLRTGKKTQLVVIASGLVLAVGFFDAIVWNGSLFHSYLTNFRFNLILGEMRTGESPAWQYFLWLLPASAGLSALCASGALLHLRRYGFLLALIALVLLVHSLQAHKEYRFVFVVVPLWLLIGADLVARIVARGAKARAWTGLSAALIGAVSVAGILNSLPYQEQQYRAWSRETGVVGFVRNQDPIFAAYRYLARAPGVTAVWQVDRSYFNLPGYYYLHREIPLYDASTGPFFLRDATTLRSSISHIVSADPKLAVPGYSVEREFGLLRILRRDESEPEVRRWREYTPIVIDDFTAGIMLQIDPNAPSRPPNAGIGFAALETPGGRSEDGRP